MLCLCWVHVAGNRSQNLGEHWRSPFRRKAKRFPLWLNLFGQRRDQDSNLVPPGYKYKWAIGGAGQKDEDSILEKIEVERDLGVHIDHKPKFSTHTEIQTNKANKITGLIWRSYTLDPKSMCMLYKSLIRDLLEY